MVNIFGNLEYHGDIKNFTYIFAYVFIYNIHIHLKHLYANQVALLGVT